MQRSRRFKASIWRVICIKYRADLPLLKWPSLEERGSQMRFRQQHVNALVAVHQLGHAQITRERAQHVSFIAREVGSRTNMLHHFAHRLLGGVIEILVEANRHEVRGTFRERPFDFHILADGKTKSARNACLESGDADFSVALNAVSVACEEQGAFVKNWQVER